MVDNPVSPNLRICLGNPEGSLEPNFEYFGYRSSIAGPRVCVCEYVLLCNKANWITLD